MGGIHRDGGHAAHGLACVVDALRIDGVLLCDRRHEVHRALQLRPVLVEIVDDDGIVLRGEDEAGMLSLPLRRGERDRAESLDECRFHIGRDGAGIVHEEDERIAFLRVVVLRDVEIVGERCAVLRGIVERRLLEILDDELAHASRFPRGGRCAEKPCRRLDEVCLRHLSLHDGERLRIAMTAERRPLMPHGVSLLDGAVLGMGVDGGVDERERRELEHDIGAGFGCGRGGILSLDGVGARDGPACDLVVVRRHGGGVDGGIVGEDDAAHMLAVARDLRDRLCARDLRRGGPSPRAGEETAGRGQSSSGQEQIFHRKLPFCREILRRQERSLILIVRILSRRIR